MPKQKRVIIAPLDWGLGHATRCVPVVHALLKLRCKVWAVLTPPQQALYEPIFGKRIEYVPFDEPPVDYRGSFSVAMLRQLPKLASRMRRENSLALWLAEKIKPDLIISDNRYGFKVGEIKSVMIGHQLQLRVGLFSFAANTFNHKLMRGFDEIWVPDVAETPNLSGKLSHGSQPENKVVYTGPLSRLKPAPASPQPQFDWLALLSGPEPQRTRLEELLISMAQKENLKMAIVAGKPEEGTQSETSDNITYFPHLEDVALLKLVADSRAIVCRSGYSTLCDLLAMNRRALLIPTPGQTEQQYLGRHFKQSFNFEVIRQENRKALSSKLAHPELFIDPFELRLESKLNEVMRAVLKT